MTIADEPVGQKPVTSIETVTLSALVQATAGTVTSIGQGLSPADFSPAGAIIVQTILDHAHDAAQQDKNAVLNLPMINAALNAQGAFCNSHDTGTQALMNEIATTPADPVFLPQLVAALKQQTWRQAGEVLAESLSTIDWHTIGITESDQHIQHALNAYQQARSRVETNHTNNTTGGNLHVA